MEVANSILAEAAPAIGTGKSQNASGEASGGLFAVTLDEMISNLSTKIGLIDKFLANIDQEAGADNENGQDGEVSTDEVVAVKSDGNEKTEKSIVDNAAQGSVISELVSNMTANNKVKQVLQGENSQVLVENAEVRLDPIDNIGGSLPQGFVSEAVQAVLAQTLDAGGVAPGNDAGTGSLPGQVVANELVPEEPINLFQPANDEVTVSNAVINNPIISNEGEIAVSDNSGNPPLAQPQTGNSAISHEEASSMVDSGSDTELGDAKGDQEKAKSGDLVTRMTSEKSSMSVENDKAGGKSDVGNGVEVRALLRELIPEKHQLIESLRMNDQLKPSFAVTNNAAGTGDKTYLQVPVRDVVQQMVDQIALIVSQDKSNARIQLKPEFLGELKVRIDLTGNQVTAKLEAASSIAKELLEAGVAQVKQALQSHGLKVDDVIVQLRGDQFKQANHERFSGGNQDGEHGNGSQRRFSQEQEEKQRRYLLGGLNEWVA